jgi:conjugal transfer mating pair stabilization protein TraN
MRARSILLSGLAPSVLAAAAVLAATPLAAQTVDPKAAASAIASQLQGQVTGNVTSQSAPNAVPGYGGADLPQGNISQSQQPRRRWRSRGGHLAALCHRHQPEPPDGRYLDARPVERQAGREQPDELHRHRGQFAGQLPARSGEQRDASTYYDSCQIGTAEADSSFTCTIGWANQFTSAYQYTCHTSEWDIYNPYNNLTFFWGMCQTAAALPASLPARRSARPNSPRRRPGRRAPTSR